MKCALSNTDCRKCPQSEGAQCEIFIERDIMFKDLKRLQKHLDNTLTIINAILEK